MTTAADASSPRSQRPLVAELAFLIACPGLAFWLMSFSPVVQNTYLDPYFYTGYINNFVDLVERYGITYYAVRFGLIIPAQLATVIFGSTVGYFVLRYVLALVAGLPFYVLIRQRYGRPTAAAMFCLLMTSPYLARTVLWDHPDASGVPFLFAAMCLYSIEHRQQWLLYACAGACAGMAIHSNVFTIAPLAAFVGASEAVGLAWAGGFRQPLRRLLGFAAGVILVTALGAGYYWWRFQIGDIFSVTFSTAMWLVSGGLDTWRSTGLDWLGRRWWALTPALLVFLAPLAWSRRHPRIDEVALWAGASTATAFFYFNQFVMHGVSLEVFYYFSYALPALFLLFALLIGRLWEHLRPRTQWMAAGLIVVSAVGPWIIYSFDLKYFYPFGLVRHLCVGATAAALFVVATRMQRGRSVTTLLATAALGLVLFSSFAGKTYAAVVNSRRHQSRLEQDVYNVALQFMRSVPAWQQSPGQIRFWYSNEPPVNSVRSIQSTYLWEYSKLQGDGPGLPFLGGYERELVNRPDVKWLALLSENPEQLALGRAALLQNGVRHTAIDHRILSKGAYTLHIEILDLHKDR